MIHAGPSGSAAAPHRMSLGVTVLALLLILTAVPLLYLAAVAASSRLLAEPGELEPVDTIVVLGGDGPARAEKAVEVWAGGFAEHVIVAGDGDCTHIADALVAGGVPREAIGVDCLSGNTWMNAVNSAPLLEASSTHSALLVTSWFHTGRALGTFRAICPGIRWVPVSTPPPSSLITTATGPYGPAIAKEYVKVVGYWLRRMFFPPSPPTGHACVSQPRHT